MVMRGSTTPVTVTFRAGPGGALVDPTAITLTFRYDDAVVHTAAPSEIVHDSLGQYHYDWNVPLDASPGTYVAVWQATMPGDALPSYGYDNIAVTAFPPGLPGYDGCDWPIDPACLSETWEGYSPEVRQRAVSLASATLYRLTGYRVGGCPLTVRPRAQNGSCAVLGAEAYMSPFIPTNFADTWTNVPCFAADPRIIALPQPVGKVYEVKVNGAVLDEANWAICTEGIVWTGTGEAPWPVHQDWTRPDTEVGTMSVTYLNGYPVDALGAYAAGLLATEFAKACSTGGAKCRLPSNIVGIARQGVSYEMVAGAFPDGKTAIREVDAFIETWNPKNQQPGMVFDPGAPKVRVQR